MGFAIGIGGISRAGKSTSSRRLGSILECPVIGIDSYQISPVKKVTDTGEEWEDWEDPIGHDLERFYQDLVKFKETHGLVIAEGFILYHDPRIVNELNLKVHIDLPKEVAKARRAATKNLTPNFEEYYEHIWSAYYTYNDLSSQDIVFLDGEASVDDIISKIHQIYNQRISTLASE